MVRTLEAAMGVDPLPDADMVVPQHARACDTDLPIDDRESSAPAVQQHEAPRTRTRDLPDADAAAVAALLCTAAPEDPEPA